MGINDEHVHHPGIFKQPNKMHKHGRHRSKGSIERLNRGRALLNKIPGRKSNQDLSREQRRNQMQMIRKKKREDYLEIRRGLCEAPFLVAVIPLNNKINPNTLVEYLKLADPEAFSCTSSEGFVYLKCPRLKHKFTLAAVHGDNLFDKLDLLKVSTTVLFLTSVQGIDEDGAVTLSAALAQGLPTVTTVVTDIASLPPKKWQDGKNKVEAELQRYLPSVDKILTMDKPGDGLTILRKIALQKQTSIIQRDRRPHLLSESTNFVETGNGEGTLKVTGYLRGVNIDVNSLVHIPGWGDFQISMIEAAPLPGESMSECKVLHVADPEKQTSLESENIPDEMDTEQTWPTKEELENADQEFKEKKKMKKVPRGMGEYMAAWIPDEDAVEVESDFEEEEGNDKDGDFAPMEEEISTDEENDIDETGTTTSETPEAPEAYDQQMDLDEEKATHEKIMKAKQDEMFPDEVDTPHSIPARTRFARYRGLKSFRTTPWDPFENLPADYARIFRFDNFKRARSVALSRSFTGPNPGCYITIHITKVPMALYHLRGSQPIVVYGLLAHEHKMSVMNVVLKRTYGSTEPIASKEKLMFQVGFRRFSANPIFSQHTLASKHKYERYFQSDSVVVASMFAPIMYPPASVIVFKENKEKPLDLVARGTVLSMDPNRVVVKRAVLSGHPMKILKRSAVIRFMFFNREDIDWFKPIELKTKYGRSGHIKDALGTHGHMKCVFNSQLKSQDTVLLNLYKRVFPKWTYDPCVNFMPIAENL